MRTFFIQLVVLSAAGLSAFGLSTLVEAQTIEELEQKISSTTEKREKLNPVIKQLEKAIDNTVAKEKTLGTEIKILDLTKKKLETEIKITQTKVDTTDLKIRQLGSEIAYKEDEISVRKAALKEALLSVYESDEQSLAQVALSNESFSGLWNDLETLEEFSSSVTKNVELIKSLRADLEIKNKAKQAEKGKLLGLKEELGDKKKITEQTTKQKAQLLKVTSNQAASFQKKLKQTLALKDALEKELRDYESTLKFRLVSTSFPPRGTKVFASPLNPLTIITQQFGKTSSSGRLYASGTHNGTDFRARTPVQLKAMLSGTVVGTGDTDQYPNCYSYGKWILVKHNNGLSSLYAHLSLVKVSTGDQVSTGQVIGYTGYSGYVDPPGPSGAHLHLTVFVSDAVKIIRLGDIKKTTNCAKAAIPVAAINAYLDPMDYL